MPDRLAQFAEGLLDPDRPVPEGIVGPDGKPSALRFGVYRNNVVVSLIEAMQAAYPVVAKLVGEEFFQAMARIFVVQVPPKTPLMLDYGDGFADFIERFPPAAGVPYLADTARLERAWLEAYHAAEALPLGSEELSRIPADRLDKVVLELHPSLRIVSSAYPIVSIWQANSGGETTPHIDLAAGEDALVLRPDADVELRALPRTGTSAFLGALAGGRTVTEASIAAFRDNPNFDLTGNLANLVALEAITGWHLGEDAGRQQTGGNHVLANI